MKKISGAMIAMMLLLSTAIRAESMWTEDFPAAFKKAGSEGRYLLVNFSGSDWCGWCIRLDREVFSTEEFEAYARDNLVCVLIDAPRKKQLPPEVHLQNEHLRAQFKVTGYPSIFLLDPSGRMIARTGYQPGGAAYYIQHLQGFMDARLDQPSGAGP